MSSPAGVQPIIVIKKKGHHGGHHGGAWKVAYADFVTAMMALFMVMWLMNATPEVKKAVGGYFRDPHGSGKKTGTNMGNMNDGVTLTKDTMSDLKDKLEQAMKKQPQFEKLKDNVEITITGEGLRIELLETAKGMFFNTGAPVPTEVGHELLDKLASELGKMTNPLTIEGHTDSMPYGSKDYTNWELSADRANAARRIILAGGVDPTRIKQVRGFADQRLRVEGKPEDPSNRRVSIIVGYNLAPEPEGKEEAKGEHGAKGGHGEGKGETKAEGGHGEAKSENKPESGAEAKPAETQAGEHAAAKTPEKHEEAKPAEKTAAKH